MSRPPARAGRLRAALRRHRRTILAAFLLALFLLVLVLLFARSASLSRFLYTGV